MYFIGMCFMGVCRLLGWLPLLLTFTIYPLVSYVPLLSPLFFTILFYSIPVWAVACGMCRYVFYRCVSVAWEIAVGRLWNVSVCFLWVCADCLGGCLVLLTFTVYLLFSSVLFFSLIFFTILFNCILVWTVACGMNRYDLYGCVSVAWVVASFCLHSLHVFSSRLFSSFLVYSLVSYSSIF